MAHLPYRNEHVNDADANELGLTLEEVGAFVKLKRALWRCGGYLPNEEWILARASGAGRKWTRIARALRDRLVVANGQVSVEEITEMLRVTEERRAKAVKAGRQSAVTRGFPAISQFGQDNSLKNHEATANRVDAKSEHGAKNQNQNKNLDSKTLNAPRSGTARQGNQAFYELSVEFLIKRVGVRSLAARSQIAKWLAAVEGNEADLQAIMDGADRENLNGARLIAVIDQRVGSRQVERKRGAPLPFPPNLVVNDGK
jgi:uncharacterized protein YdaU (DUF1376 family)